MIGDLFIDGQYWDCQNVRYLSQEFGEFHAGYYEFYQVVMDQLFYFGLDSNTKQLGHVVSVMRSSRILLSHVQFYSVDGFGVIRLCMSNVIDISVS